MALVRSISGLRATVGDSLTPDLVYKYAASFSEMLPDGYIIIGRDGRPSGNWIENILIGTLNACGRVVKNLSIVPTPTVQLEVEHSDAVGGIIITASHNPSEWNGLKFLNAQGTFLNAEDNAVLWNILDNQKYNFLDKKPVTDNFIVKDSIINHISKILSLPILQSNLDKIKKRKFKIVVDAVNASGSIIMPQLLKLLNCEVVNLFCDETGIFPHTPEPLPQNLTLLADAVKVNNADIGIAVDPDADRLVLIDEHGNPIGEEKTITIAVDSALSFLDKKDLNVVVNLSTTKMVEDVAKAHSCKLFRSPVGEINVVNLMKEKNAVVGGEGSGGVILPACHYGRDSLVGTALTLSLLAAKSLTLSELAKTYTNYSMLKFKMPFSGCFDEITPKVQALFNNVEISTDDGIRIDFPDKWVQIRKSNTEPIIRIIAEAPEHESAQELISTIRDNI